jgi:xylan 1,4-beta-xylosidase
MAFNIISTIDMKVLLITIFALLSVISVSGQPQNDRQIYLADPAVLFDKGTYYLYGTVEGNADAGFQVYTSPDQKTWTDKGFALKKGEAFGDKGFWAPQVFAYNGQFHMAYVANENIALTTSDSPLGPFRQKEKKPLAAPVKQIDPYVYIDADGRIYLYHVRLQEGNRIFVAEMKPDLSGIIEETLQECLHAENGWENTANSKWPVAEGPTILKKNNLYYLFYTANDFRNPDYAVGFATSDKPTGPWTKYSGNPILSRKDIGQNGTGHGDFYFDKKGGLHYVFHTHHSEAKVAKRKTATINVRLQSDKSSFDKPLVDYKSFRFLTTK